MNNKNWIYIFIGLTIIVLAILKYPGIYQLGVISGSQYIESPVFCYYECAPASQALESVHTSISTGSSGWITIPSNTDKATLWISQTESTAWYSVSRRLVYQVCHSSGSCDNQVYITSDKFLSSKNVPSVNIPIITGDKVFVNYQEKVPKFSFGILIGYDWADRAGSEYYMQYTPYVLWVDGDYCGGRYQYSTPEQGCSFKSSETSKLIDSVTQLSKNINAQTSTSDYKLNFYETRNFISNYAPLNTDNVNFVTYNGKEGYCLRRQIFSISTVTTNSGTYKIVDSNFNNLLASQVACCPGENEPTRTCNSNYQWVDKTIPQEGQCSSMKPCEGADWAPSPLIGKTLIRYNCQNSQCIAETKNVECSSNLDCSSGQVCSLSEYKCYTLSSGEIINPPQNKTENDTQTTCKWYQEEYSTKDYGLLGWRKILNNPIVNSGCQTSDWVYVAIITAGIVFIVYINKNKRRKR